MNEKHKIIVPLDNYGRVYIGMLEGDLSSRAKLCFGVMWSFGGSETWASVESIGRRMSASRNTVREAQEELVAAGWIRLVGDSKGRNTKTWQLFTSSTVQNLTPNRSESEQLTAQELTPKKELKQEPKKEPEGFVLFWNLYSKKTTKAESLDYWTRKLKPDLELQGSILAGLTLENQARAAAEAKGTFFPAPADPIRWLKKHRWEDQHSATPAPGQPSTVCQHPHDKANWERTFKDGMQIGHCGLCGRPVNRMVEPPKRDEE